MQNIKDTMNSWLAALPYKVGDVVWCTYTEPASERVVEGTEISSDYPSGVCVLLAGVRTATQTELWIDSGWVEPIKVEEPLPYKVGDVVHYVVGKSRQRALVEAIYGNKVRFKGCTEFVESQCVEVINEEQKVMTDIKWIPLAHRELPEGRVIVVSRSGKIEFSEPKRADRDWLSNVVAYIPVDDLKQLWEVQNPAARYSKESEAYKLLEWTIQSEGRLAKALREITLESIETIEVLADYLIDLGLRAHKIKDTDERLFEELVYWLKEYITANAV